jgi:carbonic anhydrase
MDDMLEELLARNRSYADHFRAGGLPGRPALGLAVVACMDARLDLHRILGLAEGDAHILRNAGGAVTEDVLRSLVVSQRLLGTRRIVLVHHTDCGMTGFRDEALKEEIERETGIRPPFAFETFTDVEEDVRQSIRRIKACPFLPYREEVLGFVYDVATGIMHPVP